MTKIRYVGPYAEAFVALDPFEDIEEATGRTCKHGDEIELPASLVGKAPGPNDPGEGLLAQVDNWEPAGSRKPKPKAAKAATDAPADAPADTES